MKLLAKTCGRCGLLRDANEYDPRFHGRTNRAAACRSCTAKRENRRRHGLTAAEKVAIAVEQGGCAICRTMDTGRQGWVVDHDHRCCPGERSCEKCRRGVLCTYCNSALGYAKDDPARLRAMAGYLEQHAARISPLIGSNVSPLTPLQRLATRPPTNGRDGRTDGDSLTLREQVAFRNARRGGTP
jgi:hypothetical protein